MLLAYRVPRLGDGMLIEVKYEARDRLLERHPKVEKCLMCGTCSLACYITRFCAMFDPKNNYTYHVFGVQQPEKNPSLWLCVSCHKCYEICPYDVNPMEVIEALKEVAFGQGYEPDLVRVEIEQIVSTGFAFPVYSSTHSQRERLGLPSLEKGDVDDLAKIVGKTGLRRRLDALKEGG
ncbi:MAG: 4Fe-4S dicluster domain-containing protein [Candidatus Bathyarchaeia archaeon]